MLIGKLGKKSVLWILATAVVGVALLAFGQNLGGTATQNQKKTDEEMYNSVSFYTESLESRIEALCKQVKGVNEVHVLLTLDGGLETVYAENKSGAACDYVIIEGQNGEEPVFIREIYPQIRGVAVVCSHGNDSEVQRTLIELLSAALGISSSRIRVAGT